MNPGIPEEAGKVAAGAIEAMKSTPLAIALLVVNVVFLAFAAYMISEISSNAQAREKTQSDLIAKLVTECRQMGPT
jgi:hypothetical protein